MNITLRLHDRRFEDKLGVSLNKIKNICNRKHRKSDYNALIS